MPQAEMTAHKMSEAFRTANAHYITPRRVQSAAWLGAGAQQSLDLQNQLGMMNATFPSSQQAALGVSPQTLTFDFKARTGEIPANASREELERLLRASQSRIVEFRRNLWQEESVLRQQVQEIQEAEAMQLQLESQVVHSPPRENVENPDIAANVNLNPDGTPVDELDVPMMTLADVKRHLDTAHQLRRRVQELEESLQRKGAEVTKLSSHLRIK
jgi:hypothetical protein